MLSDVEGNKERIERTDRDDPVPLIEGFEKLIPWREKCSKRRLDEPLAALRQHDVHPPPSGFSKEWLRISCERSIREGSCWNHIGTRLQLGCSDRSVPRALGAITPLLASASRESQLTRAENSHGSATLPRF
ncbi:MAG: hypothetical protein V3T64_13735, partial [Myxococcota bacterium]